MLEQALCFPVFFHPFQYYRSLGHNFNKITAHYNFEILAMQFWNPSVSILFRITSKYFDQFISQKYCLSNETT